MLSCADFMILMNKLFKQQVKEGIAVASAAILLLSGCMGSSVYHGYQPISKEGWSKHDTIIFQLPKDSIPDTYSLEIGLRTRDTYRYTSIWLVVEQDLEKKGVFTRDTINFPVTDHYGNILGYGFSAHQQEIPVKKIAVNPGGGITVKLYHIMKREVIEGVTDAGINVLSDSLQRLSSRK